LLITSGAVGNLPPALRSGVSGGATNYTEAFTSSGSSVDEFWSFNKNLWGDHMYDYLVWGKGSYGGLLGNSGSYYVEATGGIFIDGWLWFSGANKTVTSNNF